MWPNPHETADLVTFTEEILKKTLLVPSHVDIVDLPVWYKKWRSKKCRFILFKAYSFQFIFCLGAIHLVRTQNS